MKSSVATVTPRDFLRLVHRDPEPLVIEHEQQIGAMKRISLYRYVLTDYKGIDWFTEASKRLDIAPNIRIEAEKLVLPDELTG